LANIQNASKAMRSICLPPSWNLVFHVDYNLLRDVKTRPSERMSSLMLTET
jgi:hypothetical protein